MTAGPNIFGFYLFNHEICRHYQANGRLKIKDFLGLFQHEAALQILNNKLQSSEQEGAIAKSLHLQGLAGSQDAITAALGFLHKPKTSLFILHDKDEAAYFLNDLQSLLENHNPYFFPGSYRKPYQFEEVDNANVLDRAEVLSALNQHNKQDCIIVTYPEALYEKVINRRSLKANTFDVNVGDKLDFDFLNEVLHSYDFERTEFVTEPGQFSIRGGIFDVFSFSAELPYRLELFGDEVESIRSFNPETQLSVEIKQSMSILPDVQMRLMQESREHFTDFLPEGTRIWIKDLHLTCQVLDKAFTRASSEFEKITKQSGISIVKQPSDLFTDAACFMAGLARHQIIEFGPNSLLPKSVPIAFSGAVQPSFNKDFKLMAENIAQLQARHFTVIIGSDNPKQLERLQSIFEEFDPFIKFLPLYIALRAGFEDPENRLAVYTDHQIFERFHKSKLKEKFSKSKAITLKELQTLNPGDFVTHIDYGIGRFAGLEKVEAGGRLQEAVRLVFKDDDFLFVSIHSLHKLSKYSGKEGGPPALSKLGNGEWEARKSKVKKKVRDIAKELISLYAKRKLSPGFSFSPDGYLQAELESSFLYEDTPDQAKAIADTKADMERPHPMDRLVCGDVGFGKTEVAVRAAFKAVCDSKQVAILVPTTILAMQHYKTFKERLGKLPCNVDYINRFKSEKEIKETLAKLAEGRIDILVGTHRLISQDVKFKNLGLLVIDEEQKFGVKTKDRLKEMRVNVDCLTLTATPIPRTLQFSLMGARDLSIIATPPPNRQPVTTQVVLFDETFIRDAIRAELKRNGQVFFVHNRIHDIEEIAGMILRLVPDAKIGIGHGQMEGSKLENVMLKFIDGDYDILVSTNIIESGLDIPNANTIIINRAHTIGLSDLHQMRGRVGRSNRKAYCYLLTPPLANLPSDSRKRLQTLEEFSELGDGFKVAMRDLDIRGAGDLLGAEQTGFITDLGFDAYHKILDEAIQELKETEFKDLFATELANKSMVNGCTIETDYELLIPDKYIANISERLELYNRLDNIKNETELLNYQASLADRFGPLPNSVLDLIKTVRLRWEAEKAGFEKLVLKDGILKGFFTGEENKRYFDSETFGAVLKYVQTHNKTTRLKEQNKKLVLTVNNIKTVDAGIALLKELHGSTEVLA